MKSKSQLSRVENMMKNIFIELYNFYNIYIESRVFFNGVVKVSSASGFTLLYVAPINFISTLPVQSSIKKA